MSDTITAPSPEEHDVTLEDFAEVARLPVWQRELLARVQREQRDRALQAKPPKAPPPSPRTQDEWAAALASALNERI